MSGIEGITSIGRTARIVSGRNGTQATADSGGALASAKQAVSRLVAGSGFINLTDQRQENFRVFLNRATAQTPDEDLDLDFLTQLASWIAGKMLRNPGEAKQAQANVPPDAAVTLLK